MKKSIHILFILLVTALTLFTHTVLAQAPQAIPYQAVARDNAGATLANQAIALRLSIHDATATGTIVYQETQTTTTNSLGLFNVNIGQGTANTGTLSSVNWATGSKFIQVEMDPTGGTTYTDMGTTQLMSVPYAIFANKVKDLPTNAANGNTMHWNGTTWVADNAIYNNGTNVGIGTIAPSEKLHTTGGVRHEGLSGMGSRIVYADSTGKLSTLSSLNPPITVSNFQTYTIPDNSCTGVQSNISINGFPNSIVSSKISVTIDLTHSYLHDLRIYLVAPNNDILNLCYANGGAGDNFSGTTFVDSASTNLTMGIPPYFGYYKPSGNTQAVCGLQPTVASFSVIGGGNVNPNGLWKLLVYDLDIGDLGTLNYWSIKINEANPQSNFIPKWINGILSSTSNLYDNGINVGIGTTTPSVKLHVNGIIRAQADATTNKAIELYKSNGTPGWEMFATNTGLSICEQNVACDRLVVGVGGNVGIGTSTPAAKLDVNGTIKISGGSPAVGKVLTSDATGIASWQTLNAETDPQVSSTTSNKIPKWNGTTLVDGIITDNGSNIGIGTIAPSEKLHTTGGVRHEGLSGAGLRIVYADSTGKLSAHSSLTPPITGGNFQAYTIPDASCTGVQSNISLNGFPNSILSSKISVTIDVTHPYLRDLKIYLVAPNNDILNLCYANGGYGANFSGTTFVDSASTNLTMGNAPYFGYYKPLGNTQAVCGIQPTVASFSVIGGGNINPNGLWKLLVYDNSYYDIGTLNYWSINISDNPQSNFIPKWINGGLSSMSNLYDDGTNIGIGISSPSAKLDVNGTIKISGGNPATGKVLTSDATGIASWQTETDPQVGSVTTNNIPKWDGTTLVDGTITDSSSNVGIGTTNPSAKLDVNGTIKISGGNPAVGKVLTSDATGMASWQAETDPQVGSVTTNNIPKWDGTTLVDGTITDSSSNVGIGTTNPSAKLDVNGTIKISGGNPAVGKILTSDATGIASWQTPDSETDPQVSSTSTNKIPKWNGTALVDGVMTDNGTNIGIGTTTPGAKLHVNGILRAQADASSKAIEFYQSNGTQGWEMFVNNTGLSICEQGVACDRLVVAAGGNVGIGTATPAAPLHVAGTPITTASQNRTYFHYGSAITTNFAASNSIQVRADGWFWANNGGFVATSDQRIKNKIGLTNTQGDLNDLSKIEITNYKYIDEISNGSKLHKKVIAQQLNSVYPLAVDTTKGIIPNVYEVAKHVSVKNNSTLITTNKAHDFKTGDEVKLIIENVGEKLVHVEVIDEHTFSVNEIIKDKVFVFGKHIDDLLIVDYDALTTLTISATQELLKRIQSLEKENAQLKELNEEYNAKLLHIEDRLNILSTPTSTTTAQK